MYFNHILFNKFTPTYISKQNKRKIDDIDKIPFTFIHPYFEMERALEARVIIRKEASVREGAVQSDILPSLSLSLSLSLSVMFCAHSAFLCLLLIFSLLLSQTPCTHTHALKLQFPLFCSHSPFNKLIKTFSPQTKSINNNNNKY